jgi:protein-tyrosine phosphatase
MVGIVHLMVEIDDLETESIYEHLDPCVDFICDALKQPGGCILVHCLAGMSRSASCVIAFLIREKGLEYFPALNFVKSKRPVVRPNLGFGKALIRYEKEPRQVKV